MLAHRSGIGDYYDEEVHTDVDSFVLPVPVGDLATTESYLAVLDGFPTKFAPDERFAYCNSGYVVLALLAERASRVPFHELVVQRVCEPAGMRDTGFFRSDELPNGRPSATSTRRGRMPSNCRYVAAATAASTRRSRTYPRCGARSSRGRSCRAGG